MQKEQSPMPKAQSLSVEEKRSKISKIESLVFDFIYRYADEKFYGDDIFPVVAKLIKDTDSKANTHKVINKLERIFSKAVYAFDVPEHPERHNGYFQSYQYTTQVMNILGYTTFKSKTPNNGK
jgi:hypothetical protein